MGLINFRSKSNIEYTVILPQLEIEIITKINLPTIFPDYNVKEYNIFEQLDAVVNYWNDLQVNPIRAITFFVSGLMQSFYKNMS